MARGLGEPARPHRRRQTPTRGVLLGCSPSSPTAGRPQELAGWVSRLDPTAEDRRQARDALLRLVANHKDGLLAAELLNKLLQLATTVEDKRQTRDALLGCWPTTKTAC